LSDIPTEEVIFHRIFRSLTRTSCLVNSYAPLYPNNLLFFTIVKPTHTPQPNIPIPSPPSQYHRPLPQPKKTKLIPKHPPTAGCRDTISLIPTKVSARFIQINNHPPSQTRPDQTRPDATRRDARPCQEIRHLDPVIGYSTGSNRLGPGSGLKWNGGSRKVDGTGRFCYLT